MFSKFTPASNANVVRITQAHRIFVIDCSGSMYGTIDTIRTHLKNKIPSLTKPGDYISIIWFQHEFHCGCLQEHVNVSSLGELKDLNLAMDRFLQSGGGTHFTEAMELANNIAGKYPEENAQIFFLTDGMENNKSDATRNAFRNADAATILVMYGWYTDEDYLRELAEASNGVLLFSKEFEKLSHSIDTHLANEVVGNSNLVEVPCEGAFTIVDQELKVYKSLNGIAKVPIGNTYTLYLGIDKELSVDIDSEYYMNLWYAVKSRNQDLVWALFKQSNDVYMINQFTNCFTRQEYVNFEEECKQSVLDESKRYRLGRKPNYVPKEDCFTVIQLLNLLAEDVKARMYPYHKSFTYERISRKVEQKEQFYPTRDLGCAFSLVYNASRANVSLNCKVYGYNKSADGEISAGQAYRNYACIKDSVKNFVVLPISMSRETFEKLLEEEVLQAGTEWEEDKVFEVPLEALPVVNRAMMKGKELSCELFCIDHVQKIKLMAIRKYITSRNKALDAVAKEGEEEGFQVEKKERVPSIDQYKTRELSVKVAKCSSLPTVNDKLFEKLSSGKKLTTTEAMMEEVHKEWEAANDKRVFASQKLDILKGMLKEVNDRIEQVKFAVLAAKCWFHDEPQDSYGNVVRTVEVDGDDYVVTVLIEEKIVQL
jgi:hypothetical protein